MPKSRVSYLMFRLISMNAVPSLSPPHITSLYGLQFYFPWKGRVTHTVEYKRVLGSSFSLSKKGHLTDSRPLVKNHQRSKDACSHLIVPIYLDLSASSPSPLRQNYSQSLTVSPCIFLN